MQILQIGKVQNFLSVVVEATGVDGMEEGSAVRRTVSAGMPTVDGRRVESQGASWGGQVRKEGASVQETEKSATDTGSI